MNHLFMCVCVCVCVCVCIREATVTSLPPGGTVSLGVSRRPPPDDESGELLARTKLGDGEKTWGFCSSDGGAAATVG